MSTLDIENRISTESVLEPILVSTKQARQLLGISRNRFWQLATSGALGKIVGTSKKRYVFYKGLQRYADNLEAATYSRKSEQGVA